MGIFRQLNYDQPKIAPDTKVIRGADYQAHLEAQEIIQQARNEAQRILSEAVTHYQDERTRAYEDGMEQSRQEASEHMIELISRSVDYFASVEDTMVRLVLKSVRKILDDFDDTELVMKLVRNALNAVGGQKRITLRISPEQKDSVEERIHRLLASYPNVGFVDVVADRRLTKGGCVVESEVGVVDASLETQLSALENALDRVFGEHRE